MICFSVLHGSNYQLPKLICKGELHDQGDEEWIVIRGSLWGHKDMTCGRPAPGRPVGRPGSGHLQGIIGVF
jgi:hypothetical protein